MRRWLLPLVIVVGGVFLGRRLAGRMRERIQSLPERMMSMCDTMMEKMPENFPPKALFSGIAKILEQNERIISLLEGKKPEGEPTGVGTAAQESGESAAESEGQ